MFQNDSRVNGKRFSLKDKRKAAVLGTLPRVFKN